MTTNVLSSHLRLGRGGARAKIASARLWQLDGTIVVQASVVGVEVMWRWSFADVLDDDDLADHIAQRRGTVACTMRS
jgi:hypothetical protein